MIKNENKSSGWRLFLRYRNRKAFVQKRKLEGKKGNVTLITGMFLLTAFWPATEVTAERLKTYQINLPNQSVAESLASLSEQIDVLLLFPYEIAKELKANSVRGEYTLPEALERMLEGTGFSGRLSEKGVLMISLMKSEGLQENLKSTEGGEKMNTNKNLIAALMGIFSGANGIQAHDGGRYGIEEVVVTAQKRAENLQDVPLTVSAFTNQRIQQSGIQGLEGLSQIAPSLNVAQTSGATVMFLRGIGTNLASAGNEPSVATFVDGVYSPVPRTGSLYSFNDIERIEVLKGPQGTLFGRNATGGVVHVITKEPSREPTAKIRLGYGNYDTVEANFYGATGIGKNIAGDISLYHKDQGDSPFDNPVPGMKNAPEENFSWRSKLIFSPADDLSFKLIGNYTDFENSFGSLRQPLPGSLASTGLGYSGSFHSLLNDFKSYTEAESKGLSLTVDYSRNLFDFISISSYAKDEAITYFDNDGTVGFGQNSVSPVSSETITQELRFISNKSDGFTWIAGLYFYGNESGYYDPFVITTASATVVGFSEQTVKSWAVFGESRYQFSDNTGLTVGLRWNEDDLKMKGITYVNDVSSIGAYKQEDDFSKLTYKLGLDHKFSNDSLIYFTYSRGFKTGVYNLINVGRPAPAIEPEVLDALEVGYKSDHFFGGMARINAAAFWYDYQDLQLVTVSTTSLESANAAEATLMGVEIEIEARVTDRLWLSTGVGYLDTEYDQYLGLTNRPNVDEEGNPTGGNQGNIPADFSGNDLFRSPKLTYNVAVNYVLPTTIGDFSFNINYYHSGGFYWDQENRLKEPSYGLLNAGFSWNDINEKYQISVWGRNVTNEKYSTFTNNSPTSGDAYGPSMPATYGIYLVRSFF